MNPTAEEGERALVDQIAREFESAGVPPIAGRIVGRLLLSDPPHQSSAQLADWLKASRGAISTSTRMLIAGGLVERVRFAGDRSAYFRIAPGCWTRFLHAEHSRVKRLRRIADRALNHLQDRGADPAMQGRAREFRDFNAFFEREFPLLLEHWDSRSTQ